jgi:glycerol-3-phosphate responsive antiterminator
MKQTMKRKVYVDIFFCNHLHTKQAILQYLQDIKDADGLVCPTIILLGSTVLTVGIDVDTLPVCRIFSVQRTTWRENKIVVNVVRNYYE